MHDRWNRSYLCASQAQQPATQWHLWSQCDPPHRPELQTSPGTVQPCIGGLQGVGIPPSNACRPCGVLELPCRTIGTPCNSPQALPGLQKSGWEMDPVMGEAPCGTQDYATNPPTPPTAPTCITPALVWRPTQCHKSHVAIVVRQGITRAAMLLPIGPLPMESHYFSLPSHPNLHSVLGTPHAAMSLKAASQAARLGAVVLAIRRERARLCLMVQSRRPTAKGNHNPRLCLPSTIAQLECCLYNCSHTCASTKPSPCVPI